MFPSAPDWLQAILVIGIATSALRLVWVDLKKLEIEFETLAVLAGLALCQSLLWDGLALTCVRLFAGLAFWGCLVFASTRFAGLARYGAGDPPLIGVLGFLVAPLVLPWALLAAAFMLATCAWYSHRRGKKLFKSMYPAAPPLILSALCLYLPQVI